MADGRAPPPGTPLTIADREAEIRRERAKRLEKHQGLSPQEKTALRSSGWEQQHAEHLKLEDLNQTLEEQRRRLAPPPASNATYSWKTDVRASAPPARALSCINC
jgi:hypothetical protein